MVRCLKRRRTLSTDEEECAKRCKRDAALWRRSSSACSTDSDSESEADFATDYDQDLGVADAAMEVESISNLVLAFNTGLKGLSSWEDCGDALDEHTLAPLRRGTSLPDLCAKQSEVHRTPFPAAVLAV